MVSRLSPGEVESLRLDLTRAAIAVSRFGDGHTIMVDSRSNAVFSAEEVLDVLAGWIEKRPVRRATATINVQRTAVGARLLRRFLTPHPAIARQAGN